MEADPFFHCTESMRIAKRDGCFALLATDSITNPDKRAFFGKTVPSTKVAAASFAWILAPAGVFPVSTFCCRTTGNSCTAREEEAAGVCWPSNAADQKPSTTCCNTIARVNICAHFRYLILSGTPSEIRIIEA